MKRVLIFPGYGSQSAGMGKELYDSHRIVQEYFEEATQCLGINFVKLCFASSEEELNKVVHAYPALFLLGISIAAVLRERGISFDLYAGYDQGEYAAASAAGVFGLPDGLYLLQKLGMLYQEYFDTDSVAAIRVTQCDARIVQNGCFTVNSTSVGLVSITHYHSDEDVVVFGGRDAIQQLRSLLYQQPGVRIEEAPIGGGAHSLLISSIALSMRMYSEKADFHNPQVPLITGVRGSIINTGAQVKEQLIAQVTNPVYWNLVMQGLTKYDTLVIAGPAHQLYAILRARFPSKTVHMIVKESDLAALI